MPRVIECRTTSPEAMENPSDHHLHNNTFSSGHNSDAEATEKLLPLTIVNFKGVDTSPNATASSAGCGGAGGGNSPEAKLPQLSSTTTSMSIKEEEDEDTVELRQTETSSNNKHSPQLLPAMIENHNSAPVGDTANAHGSLTPKSSLSLPNDDALSASGSEGANSAGASPATNITENPLANLESSATASNGNAIANSVNNTNATSASPGTTTTGNNLLVSDIPEAKSKRKLSVQGKYCRCTC